MTFIRCVIQVYPVGKSTVQSNYKVMMYHSWYKLWEHIKYQKEFGNLQDAKKWAIEHPYDKDHIRQNGIQIIDSLDLSNNDFHKTKINKNTKISLEEFLENDNVEKPVPVSQDLFDIQYEDEPIPIKINSEINEKHVQNTLSQNYSDIDPYLYLKDNLKNKKKHTKQHKTKSKIKKIKQPGKAKRIKN